LYVVIDCVEKRHMLIARRGTDSHCRHQEPFAAYPRASTVVVLVEKRIRDSGDRGAARHARDRTALEFSLQLTGRSLLAAPGRRQRQAASRPKDVCAGEANAVGEAVSVLTVQDR
jgi:hypothetical protein